MTMNILNNEEFGKLVGKAHLPFEPNNFMHPRHTEDHFVREDMSDWEETEVRELNLDRLDPNQIVSVMCYHPNAMYYLRILHTEGGNKAVHIWRDPGTNGLTASLEDLISYTKNKNRNSIRGEGNYNIERGGIISLEMNMLWPHFEREGGFTGNIFSPIVKPSTIWFDSPQKIIVYTPSTPQILVKYTPP